MDEHIYPNEERFYAQHREGDRWQEAPLLEELKGKGACCRPVEPVPARLAPRGGAFRTLITPRCGELMGRVQVGAGGCSTAPRPIPAIWRRLERYGTAEQKRAWLEPLLAGEIRSAFCHDPSHGVWPPAMPPTSRVPSSRDGDAYVINGRTSGGPRGPAASVAGCSSSWARPTPPPPGTASKSMILVAARHRGDQHPAAPLPVLRLR